MLSQSDGEASAFDWDEDYDDLVTGRTPTAVENSLAPLTAKQAAPASTSLRATVSRWFAPALVVAALAAGVVFPEAFGFRKQSVQTASLFAPVATSPVAPEGEVTLRVYSEVQQRNFVFGLKRFSDVDLLNYATVTRTDLERAGRVMASFLEDALTLTQIEIERRNLSTPSPLRSVRDVLIQVPLQG